LEPFFSNLSRNISPTAGQIPAILESSPRDYWDAGFMSLGFSIRANKAAVNGQAGFKNLLMVHYKEALASSG